MDDLKGDLVMFEPFKLMDESRPDSMLARSVHLRNSKEIYCNIINAGDEPLTIKQGKELGQLKEVEEAQKEFERNVIKYVPLNLNKLNERARTRLKVNESKLSKMPKPPDLTSYLTCEDLIDHEIKMKVKQIKFNTNLNHYQKAQLLEVILRNKNAFQWDSNQLSQTKMAVHEVPTAKNCVPQVSSQYHIPSIAKPSLIKQTEEMLKTNVTRESTSNWRSPVLLVRQKSADGSIKYRFCIDLKKVNGVTAKDCYSLPRIDETVDVLSKSKFFSTLDVDRAFWQIPVLEADKHKLAFAVDGKLYEFNVMPFGSMNAPSTFQRLIDRVLKGLTWKQCLVYIDDVLVFGSTFEKHLMDLDEVLNRFTLSGLRLKPAKCIFGNQEVDYLGFKITEKGVRISEKKIEAITRMIAPEDNKMLYKFLCSVNYYRQLVPKFGGITEELYRMCQNRKKKCKWTPHLLKKFEQLKNILITAPVLAFPDFKKPFVIQTDASGTAIAAVLLQYQDGFWKPIAFSSRKLTETETKYSATERELLAVTEAYKNFYSTVFDRDITFYSDHEPLSTIQKLKNPAGRIGRLLNKLVDVRYKISYIPGDNNLLPDFLSRVETKEMSDIVINLLEMKSKIDWHKVQSEDEEIKNLIQLIRRGAGHNEWKKSANKWLHLKKDLFVYNGILKLHPDKLVVPVKLQQQIIRIHHDLPQAGHKAFECTLDSIRAKYHWIGMQSEIYEFCRSCDACQTFNYSNFQNVAPMKPIQLVNGPMQMIGIDYMGPFKESISGNVYIVLAVDYWSKYCFAEATKTFDAETTAKFMFNQIVCKFGIFTKVLSDQGSNFESHLIKHLCQLMGANKLHTSTYRPACNGGTERVNKTVKPCLAKYIDDSHSDWDVHLPMAVSAYNNAKHSSTGYAPFEALFNRKPVTIADVIMNNKLPFGTKIKDISEFILSVRYNANRINKIINKNLDNAHDRQKANYDKFVKQKATYKVNDTVKIINYKTRPGRVSAFEPKFLGPYTITKILGDLNYQLEAPNRKTEIVHYNRMSYYYNRIIYRENNESNSNEVNKEYNEVYFTEENESSEILQSSNINIINLLLQRSRRRRNEWQNVHNEPETETPQIATTTMLDEILQEANNLNNLALIENESMNRPTIRWPIVLEEQTARENSLSTFRHRITRSVTRHILENITVNRSTHTSELDVNIVQHEANNNTENEVPTQHVVFEQQVNKNELLSKKGKPTSRCENCGNYYEVVHGMRIHKITCDIKQTKKSK